MRAPCPTTGNWLTSTARDRRADRCRNHRWMSSSSRGNHTGCMAARRGCRGRRRSTTRQRRPRPPSTMKTSTKRHHRRRRTTGASTTRRRGHPRTPPMATADPFRMNCPTVPTVNCHTPPVPHGPPIRGTTSMTPQRNRSRPSPTTKQATRCRHPCLCLLRPTIRKPRHPPWTVERPGMTTRSSIRRKKPPHPTIRNPLLRWRPRPLKPEHLRPRVPVVLSCCWCSPGWQHGRTSTGPQARM